jgi:hypothetical protein
MGVSRTYVYQVGKLYKLGGKLWLAQSFKTENETVKFTDPWNSMFVKYKKQRYRTDRRKNAAIFY